MWLSLVLILNNDCPSGEQQKCITRKKRRKDSSIPLIFKNIFDKGKNKAKDS